MGDESNDQDRAGPGVSDADGATADMVGDAGQAEVLSGPLAQVAEWAGLGGPVVWILAVMSVLALAVSLLKLAQFLRQGVWNRGAARRAVAVLRSGKGPGGAMAALRGRKDLSSQVVRKALATASRQDARGADLAALREDVEQFAADRLEGLRGNLRLLEVIAALAPLLGLFGTVLGMITAFQQMEAAGARVSPDILSGGIWTALLTTAVGLAVAMPTVAVLTFFERAVERFAHELDSLISQVFTAAALAGPEREGRDSDEEVAHGGRPYGLARTG